MTREEAIELLKEYATRIKPFYEPKRTNYAQAIDMAIEALQFAEHFDLLKEFQSLQEVVRCKDCKWYKKIVEKSKSGLCHYDLVARCVHDEDYCSHGERREP